MRLKKLRNFLLLFLIQFFLLNVPSLAKGKTTNASIKKIYNEIGLNNKVSFQCFSNAFTGFKKIHSRKNNYLTIVDFSKPSTEKRFYIIDLDRKKLLLSTYVSHGKNSGELYAKNFSNKNNSLKSSVGFFITGQIYDGANGNSLIIKGLQKGVNDNVRKRNIVIHGAKYANLDFLKKYKRLGRSKGCLAVPTYVNNKVINLLKDGTVIYVHSINNSIKNLSLNI